VSAICMACRSSTTVCECAIVRVWCGDDVRLARVVGRTFAWIYVHYVHVSQESRTRAFSISTGWERGVQRAGYRAAARLDEEDRKRTRTA